MIDRCLKNNLIWFPKYSFGYYPVEDAKDDYFTEYQLLAKSDIGEKLVQSRINYVKIFWNDEILDIGIGCGSFIEQHGNAYGFDVDPKAILWLKNKGRYKSIYTGYFQAITFWDSLEHIKNLDSILEHASNWVFVSIPIFKNAESVMESKHFKPKEHYWYFTGAGLKSLLQGFGFEMVDHNRMEIMLGREDIHTFAFRRISNAT